MTINHEGVINFEKQPDSQLVRSTLDIKNVSDQNVAYKIKTTAPKKFMVKPI